MAYPKNFFCSGLDWRMDPSDIFKAMESDARHIWELKLYISFLGNLVDILSISSQKSIDFCQIRNFSNLNLGSIFFRFLVIQIIFHHPTSVSSSITQHPSSITQHPSSITQHQSTITQHQSSITQH